MIIFAWCSCSSPPLISPFLCPLPPVIKKTVYEHSGRALIPTRGKFAAFYNLSLSNVRSRTAMCLSCLEKNPELHMYLNCCQHYVQYLNCWPFKNIEVPNFVFKSLMEHFLTRIFLLLNFRNNICVLC